MTDYLPLSPDSDNLPDWLNALSLEAGTVETEFQAEVPFAIDADAESAITLESLGITEKDLEEVVELREPMETWDWRRDILPMLADETAIEAELAEVWRVTEMDYQPELDPAMQAQNGRALLAMHAAGIEIPNAEQFDLRTSAFHSTLEDPDTHTTSDVWFIPSVFNADREAAVADGWQSVLLTLEEKDASRPMEPIMIVPFGGVGDLAQAEVNAQQIGAALTERGIDRAFDVMQEIDAQQLGLGINIENTTPSHDLDIG
ncbi:MAG: hypothetical protein KF716_25615 [Anaerolineae bacterium]|nr:hypothetical protein [Anaerolineae bacterium]